MTDTASVREEIELALRELRALDQTAPVDFRTRKPRAVEALQRALAMLGASSPSVGAPVADASRGT